MITVTIDELTSCLKDASTGEIFETEVIELKRKSFLSKFNVKTGWHVNWSRFSNEVKIYALVLKGTVNIQGLIALTDDRSAQGVYINWACASPENDVYFTGKRRFYGVGGHLLAIAADKSMEYGYGGFLHAEAMDRGLLEHFCLNHGAKHIPLPNQPNHFILDEEATSRIRKEYIYAWSDESY